MEEILTRIAFFLTGQKYAPPAVPGLLDPPTSKEHRLQTDHDDMSRGTGGQTNKGLRRRE